MGTRSITTLVPDIYQLISEKQDGWFSEALARVLSEDISIRLQRQLGVSGRKATLSLSGMGPRCPKALWYSIRHPELAESLPAWAEIKFSFGHVLEALAITLAKAAGHRVEGEQDELEVDGIKGHRDCVIDGCIVDVKSCSSRSFHKFKQKTLHEDDPFGYCEQLDGYVLGSRSDPLVSVKDRGYILAIDKQLGHMCLYEHKIRPERIIERIRQFKEIVALPTAPDCGCGTVAMGKSGNVGLDTKASYSLQKYCCFPKLRCFLYADGPVYLTKVVRKPDVPEVDRFGNLVYN